MKKRVECLGYFQRLLEIEVFQHSRQDFTIGIPRCGPRIMLNEMIGAMRDDFGINFKTHPQDSQRQTGYRNRLMSASTTWTIRSYAQLQCDFWSDALDKVGNFFIRLNILIRGLVR